jgi:hypothetical protein
MINSICVRAGSDELVGKKIVFYDPRALSFLLALFDDYRKRGMGVDEAKKAALVRYKLIGDIDFATLYEFNEQIEQSLTKL